jgi:hypothetical protein
MNIVGKTVKLKTDYMENETKLKGVVSCSCGRKVVIDETITDAQFDFFAEKVIAESVNGTIENPVIPDAVVVQGKLDKAVVLIDYLMSNGMFSAAVISEANKQKEGVI